MHWQRIRIVPTPKATSAIPLYLSIATTLLLRRSRRSWARSAKTARARLIPRAASLTYSFRTSRRRKRSESARQKDPISTLPRSLKSTLRTKCWPPTKAPPNALTGHSLAKTRQSTRSAAGTTRWGALISVWRRLGKRERMLGKWLSRRYPT